MGLFSNICVCFFHWLCCVGVVTGIPPPGTSTPVTLGDGALGSRSPVGSAWPTSLSPALRWRGGGASEEVPHHLPHTHCLPDNTGVPPGA